MPLRLMLHRLPGTPQNPKSGWGRRTPRAAQSGVLGGIFIHQELHSSYSVPIVLNVKEYNERVQ